MIAIEYVLLVACILLLVSIVTSKVASKLGIPVLLLFLVVGMLAGSDGPGGIVFDDSWAAQLLSVMALALILFSGGQSTRWSEVRPTFSRAILLATVGVLLTGGLLGWFVSRLLGWPLLRGMLVGAIVSSTDAAAVFAVLRSKGVSLRGELRPLLELESSSNDPMAVLLTVGVIALLQDPTASPVNLVVLFVRQMALGAVLGYVIGRGAVWLFNRVDLDYDGLYSVLSLALALLTYAATASVGGSGFLAAYICGLVLGNHEFIHKRSLVRFHDGLGWLMQVAMFVTLGLLVYPSQLVHVAGAGLLISLFLMVIARPISVLGLLLPFKMPFREKVLIAWVGLRGAAPVILATFPLLAGVPDASLIFHLIFFVVLTSALLQGTTIPLVAKWLGVDAPLPSRDTLTLGLEAVAGADSELIEVLVPKESPAINRRIVDLSLPERALVVLIHRQGGAIIPRGDTTLLGGDRVLVLSNNETLGETCRILGCEHPEAT